MFDTAVEMFTAKSDPRVRKDGKCVVCKKARPDLAVFYDCPFCSATCCRLWHKVP